MMSRDPKSEATEASSDPTSETAEGKPAIRRVSQVRRVIRESNPNLEITQFLEGPRVRSFAEKLIGKYPEFAAIPIEDIIQCLHEYPEVTQVPFEQIDEGWFNNGSYTPIGLIWEPLTWLKKLTGLHEPLKLSLLEAQEDVLQTGRSNGMLAGERRDGVSLYEEQRKDRVMKAAEEYAKANAVVRPG